MGQVSSEAVWAALNAVDCPASKEVLVDAAAAAGGDEDVEKALRSLPIATYDNVEEVVRSVDTVETTGQFDADKSARARDRSHPGVAEHMRDTQAPRLEPD